MNPSNETTDSDGFGLVVLGKGRITDLSWVSLSARGNDSLDHFRDRTEQSPGVSCSAPINHRRDNLAEQSLWCLPSRQN